MDILHDEIKHANLLVKSSTRCHSLSNGHPFTKNFKPNHLYTEMQYKYIINT